MREARTACSFPPQDGQTSPHRSPYLSSGTELNHTNLSPCGSYPNGTPRPAHFEAIEPHFMSCFDTTYMRRIVRAGRCRCGNRVGSPKERPARSARALHQIKFGLEAPSRADSIRTVCIGSLGSWESIAADKKSATGTKIAHPPAAPDSQEIVFK